WPFVRRRDRPAPLLPLPPDEREQLTEAKRVALAALRELDFEHAAGHVSDVDFADLRARYEAEAAATLRALDALPAASARKPAPTPAPAGRGWRHPAPLGTAAVAVPVFDRALALAPDYPPALLYRGQLLYEAKKDAAGAIRSWERFVTVVPAGEDRTRVERMIAEAKARPAGK